MDEIIGLLFLIVPVIFSLIGKKLEKAGKGEGPVVPPVPEVSEPAPREAPRSIRKRPQPQPQSQPQPADEHQAGVEKIDPKKLVIYSEIMKPKFKE